MDISEKYHGSKLQHLLIERQRKHLGEISNLCHLLQFENLCKSHVFPQNLISENFRNGNKKLFAFTDLDYYKK